MLDIAGRRKEPIPVFAEMGSINPVFVFPQALDQGAEALAKEYIALLTLRTGRFVPIPEWLLVLKARHWTGLNKRCAPVSGIYIRGPDAVETLCTAGSISELAEAYLPEELKDENGLQILRIVNGQLTMDDIASGVNI